MGFDDGISLGANVTLSDNNCSATGGATANVGATAINAVKVAGKYYMEFNFVTDASPATGAGRIWPSWIAGLASAFRFSLVHELAICAGKG